MTTSSVRRFCARPSAVAFDATGLVSPKPRAVRRDAGMPHLISQSRTALARRFERPMLYCIGADAVGVPIARDVDRGLRLERLAGLLEDGLRIGTDVRLVEVEVDAAQHDLLLHRRRGSGGGAAATLAAGAGGGAGGDCCSVSAMPAVV